MPSFNWAKLISVVLLSGTNDAACSNNIYIGPGAITSAAEVSNSIMLGSGATSGVSNEFMISNIDHLNIPSLTTSTDGTGTLLQWGGAKVGWVQASGGTYNSVSKIDTAISTLQSNSGVSSTGPFVPTFSFEVNCTAASVNSGYSYYGEDFYNPYMLFTVNVTGSSVSSFSFDVSDIPRQFPQDIGEWPENQILIPDWTHFHCPGATLVLEKEGHRRPGQDQGKMPSLKTGLSSAEQKVIRFSHKPSGFPPSFRFYSLVLFLLQADNWLLPGTWPYWLMSLSFPQFFFQIV